MVGQILGRLPVVTVIASSVTPTIDFNTDGRHVGDLRVTWSDNTVPLGYHPVPVVSIRRGEGPVVVLFGGTHGDEFEGPAALMRLVNDLQLEAINGQIIIVPALNTTAVTNSSRVSPLDGINLNRAFPGNATGSITEQIACCVETQLLAMADAAIDFHSGGKASFFQPCTLATRTEDKNLYERNLELAAAFGLPLLWILSSFNDNRSLNAAAERAGVPMIATELGGGGGVDPEITDLTEAGLYGVLQHMGVLSSDVPERKPMRKVEIKATEHSLYAQGEGVFDRKVSAGQDVIAGQVAGYLHYVNEPRRPSETIKFAHDGYVLAHTQRGYVTRGDLLALVLQDSD